jgi:uncharacterized protein (DUF697 family)
MLLRASRATELVKEASVLGASIRAGLGGIGRTARGVGKKLWKHKKGLGVAGMVTVPTAMGATEAVRRSNQGMNRAWTAARMQGRVPMAPGMSGVGLNRGWGRTR